MVQGSWSISREESDNCWLNPVIIVVINVSFMKNLEEKDQPSQECVKEQDGKHRQNSPRCCNVLPNKDCRSPCGPQKGHSQDRQVEERRQSPKRDHLEKVYTNSGHGHGKYAIT